MSDRKIWLLKLVPPMRHGRILTGLLLLAVLLPLFYAGAGEVSTYRTPALFFSLIIAYIIPVFSFITMKSQQALGALRPLLDLDAAAFEEARARLDTASPRTMLICAGAGALGGCAHISLILGTVAEAVTRTISSISGALTAVGTLMVWIIMTTVITMLIQQSVLFGRLGGGKTRVSLLNTRQLLPFARVSISSSLAVIGALALFPLIGLEGGQNLLESLPGAIAIIGPLVVMFVIPVWPLHRRLAAMKQQELAALNARIGTHLDATGAVSLEAADLEKILPLLSYRREIVQVSTWPFDLGNITTLAFYLIIPPLTWVGAALIQNLVDGLI